MPVVALEMMLAMLGDLSERIGRTKSWQAEQVEQQRKGSAKSSIFDWVLG